MKILDQAGDTIVEVLLAITIVSAVLAGAYASSNRSLNATRQSQERVEALKIVEAQLERLKVVAADPLAAFPSPNYFCIDTNLAIVPLLTTNRDDFTGAYPNQCRISPLGGVTYHISIEQNGDLFTIIGMWDRAGTKGRERINATYRVY